MKDNIAHLRPAGLVLVILAIACLLSSRVADTAQATNPGLVAAYGFDEGSGSSVADASGNGNTGSVSGATWTAGKYGNGLFFNGANALVSVPDAASLHLTTGMTVEAWVNPSSVSSAWRDVVYKGNDNYYLEGTSTRSGKPMAGAIIGGSYAETYASSSLTANSWSYLSATYDGSAVRLYVNGSLVSSRAASGSIATSTNPLQIGGDSLYGQFFQGVIDEVRVYNVALSQTQIQSDMGTPVNSGGGGDKTPPTAPSGLTASAVSSSQINLSWTGSTDNVGVTGYYVWRCQGGGCSGFVQLPGLVSATSFSDTGLSASTSYSYEVQATDAAGNLSGFSNIATMTTQAGSSNPGLVAAYGFDEGSGSSVADASGNGNTGSVSGATWTAGKYGNGLFFNGTNALVSVPDAASLHLTTGMTVEAWVNPQTTSGAWRDVVYKGNDNYYLEGTSPTGPPVAGAIIGGSYANANGTTPLTTNSWSFLSETYDGSAVRLYVNGSLVSSSAASGSIATSTNPLQIGGDSLYGQYFQGTIDNVRVYNIALTQTQIQSDMNTPIPFPSTPTNLTATAVSSSQINLSWTASTDALGIKQYLVERCQPSPCSNFTQVGTAAGTTFSDSGLSANTPYSYRVRAQDAAGNLSGYSNLAYASTGLAITPRVVTLTFTQTQQFTATVPGSPSVTWSVDGVVGGNASTGTITSGLYTPPQAAGTHVVTASTSSQSANATVYVSNYPGVLTFHDDIARTGQDQNEPALSPSTVNSVTFGKLFTYPLDGMTFASPLYVPNVSIPGKGNHNVVYVATEHDSVFAFDANGRSTTPLWQTSFINPSAGVTTVPAADTGETGDIPNEIGITGTPVIDPSTGTLYVVAKTKEVSNGVTSYVQRLHALDISTGAEKFGGPVVIQATVPGTGSGSTGGHLSLDPLRENQRAALLLENGVVYIGFSSHGDVDPFHGWLLGYNASNLQQTMVFCSTPTDQHGGIWMDGDGPAADSAGNLFLITGDGGMDANSGGSDYGDSFLKLNTSGSVLDYFSPSVQSQLDVGNLDLGSGGVLLLPDQSGAHQHEMISAGKNGTIYLVDRDNMGHYNSSTDHIVQELVNIFAKTQGEEGGNFSSPVYYNGNVYFSPVEDSVQAFQLASGQLSTAPTSRSSEQFDYRGGTMSISANGATNGILWALQSNGSAAGTLHAYDASNLGHELYNSDQAGLRDALDSWSKFTTPVVANGDVFVASKSQLTIYGLFP